jgi:hypothetical protein
MGEGTPIGTEDETLLTLPVGQCGSVASRVSRQEYASAQPWPHIVVDGAFDPALIQAAETEQTAVARGLRPHVSRHLVKAERSRVVGQASEQLMAQLDSKEWVDFLAELTGVEDLEADPSHFWAGLHVGPTGAFQRVHRDFQKHPANGLVYLSSGGSPDVGGELELWSADAKGCVRSIAPEAGRLVIFESNPTTPHAVAHQTSPDPDRLRLSFATYYFSPHPPAGGVRRTGALFQPRVPGEPLLSSMIDVADALRGAGRRASMIPARVRRLVRGSRSGA